MEVQFVVLDGKFILREIERLFDQVDVLVFHGSFVFLRYNPSELHCKFRSKVARADCFLFWDAK